jgi:hypothetical protein
LPICQPSEYYAARGEFCTEDRHLWLEIGRHVRSAERHAGRGYEEVELLRKQEFYEGAALHVLARTGRVTSISYPAPYFLINGDTYLLLKYSAKGRSPWGFTFTCEEQASLTKRAAESRTFIGLVCGSDGVAALQYEIFRTIAAPKEASLHIACHRDHGEHYEVKGPDGRLGRKIAPASWQRILGSGGDGN